MSVGVDNTSVNIGIRNSLKSRITVQNPAIYFNGCPCHILHNCAQKSADASSKVCGFDVEEFDIDLTIIMISQQSEKTLFNLSAHFVIKVTGLL